MVLLLVINLLLLVVGTFMDMTPAVLIFTPIFLPVVRELGMSDIQFGIMIIVNLCIGLCTPPVGSCLFIGCGIGKTTIAKVTGPMLPFFAAMILALLLITFIPWLSMWLPGWRVCSNELSETAGHGVEEKLAVTDEVAESREQRHQHDAAEVGDPDVPEADFEPLLRPERKLPDPGGAGDSQHQHLQCGFEFSPAVGGDHHLLSCGQRAQSGDHELPAEHATAIHAGISRYSTAISMVAVTKILSASGSMRAPKSVT